MYGVSGAGNAGWETRAGAPPTIEDEVWLWTQEQRSAAECWWPSWSASPSAWCSSSVAANEGKASRRSEEHTSELQSRLHLVCRLLLEKKKKTRRRRPPSATAR